MSLYEYDKERHIRQEKEASYEEGVKMGEEIGIRKGEDELLRKQICKNLERGLSIPEIAELLDQSEERILELRGKM